MGTEIADAGLLFHIWPLQKAEELLNWHFDVLTQRTSLFTGIKVVTVARSPNSFDVGWVKKHLPWADIYIDLPNDPQRREVAGWVLGWPSLESNKGPVFFCHAKGVTRVGSGYNDQARDWSSLLYRTSLDVPKAVREQLDKFPLAGSLKKVGRGFAPESPSRWHYHGAFYWIRPDLFPKWKNILPKWFGVESWPGDVVWDHREAGTLFLEAPIERLNMYNRTWCKEVLEKGEEWIQNQKSLSSTATCPMV